MQGINYVGNALAGFQTGRQMRQDMETQRAMGALMANPQDPQAMQRLGQFNPQMAMQYRKQQQEAALKEIDAKKDRILAGAQIFRAAKAQNPNVPDEQVYASILPSLQQMGIDTRGLPQPNDPQLPQYLQSIMAIADGLKPQTGQQDPGIIREFDIARQRGLVPPQTTYEDYVRLRNPGAQAPIILPHNVQPVGGRGGGGQPVRVNSPQEVEALPPGATFIAPDGSIRVKPGGTAGNGGGGFLGPL